MARGLNKAILIGNLGNDPESRVTQGGVAVTVISLATSSLRKERDGQTQERTEWHRVKLFGKLGEIAAAYLRKGTQVYIEGSIRYDKFTGKDGQERYINEILADVMQMLGGSGAGQTAATPEVSPPRGQPTIGSSVPPEPQDFGIDDPPF